MSTVMTPDERETFLADLHVGVISIARPDRAPLTVPVWYSYTPGGEVRLITGEASRKAQALREAGRFSLCAQSEAPPYRYVTVEGAVDAVEAVDVERDLRPMARRYLGLEAGDRYVAANGGSAAGQGSVLVRMRPQRWLTVDYGKES
jgi:PPOX class probable F420-dependent enzyme